MAKSLRPCARKDAIRLLREAKGWGQQALADRAVVSIKTLNSVEQGKPAQLSTFGKIAKALAVEPSAFLEGHETNPPPAAPAGDQAARRVEVKLTLSIPFEDFDETEGLDRLVGLLTSLMNAKNAVTITELSPGSIELTMLVDEEDAPRLMQAFSQHKLDVVQATQLDLPRTSVLLFIAAHVAQGVANPILVPVMPFVGYMLLLNHLRNAGISVELADADHIRLKKTDPSSALPAGDTHQPFASVDSSIIRQAVEVVTPPFLAPGFPCQIGLRLQPNKESDAEPVWLGEQLESRLNTSGPLRGKVHRASPAPDWTGEVSLELASLEDLRAMSEAVLAGFLGQPVTLIAKLQRTGTFLGGRFSMDAEVATNLAASVWESIAQEIGKALDLGQ